MVRPRDSTALNSLPVRFNFSLSAKKSERPPGCCVPGALHKMMTMTVACAAKRRMETNGHIAKGKPVLGACGGLWRGRYCRGSICFKLKRLWGFLALSRPRLRHKETRPVICAFPRVTWAPAHARAQPGGRLPRSLASARTHWLAVSPLGEAGDTGVASGAS